MNQRLASISGHPFWIDALESIQRFTSEKISPYTLKSIFYGAEKDWGAEVVSGPVMLYKLFNSFTGFVSDFGEIDFSKPNILSSGIFYLFESFIRKQNLFIHLIGMTIQRLMYAWHLVQSSIPKIAKNVL